VASIGGVHCGQSNAVSSSCLIARIKARHLSDTAAIHDHLDITLDRVGAERTGTGVSCFATVVNHNVQ